jgi:hypothetical protein
VQAGRLEVISVRTGITDGQSTVVEGEQLEEGMPVIAAVTTGTASSSPSPFGGQQQPGPGRFRGGF